jgi:hypothetical protein
MMACGHENASAVLRARWADRAESGGGCLWGVVDESEFVLGDGIDEHIRRATGLVHGRVG